MTSETAIWVLRFEEFLFLFRTSSDPKIAIDRISSYMDVNQNKGKYEKYFKFFGMLPTSKKAIEDYLNYLFTDKPKLFYVEHPVHLLE